MSREIKTVPNQKVVNVNKEATNGLKPENHYASINLMAMSEAALDLDGNCFKLWIYFAKNQNNYTFALSSKAVKDEFGLKTDAYNRAIKILQEKRYLIEVGGNQYKFYEKPRVEVEVEEKQNSVIGKTHNDVMGKTYNDVIGKTHKPLQEKPIRNNTDTTLNNTLNNTEGADSISPLRSENESYPVTEEKKILVYRIPKEKEYNEAEAIELFKANF